MTLPAKVRLREVGPREGFQLEDRVYPTEQKAALIEALAQTGLQEVEVTSFVRADVVPQMADAEQLVAVLRTFPGVHYSAVYLNEKGYERVQATGKLHCDHFLTIDGSETFSRRNTNATLAQRWQRLEGWLANFQNRGVQSVVLGVSSAFGCNYEGDIPLSTVLDRLQRLFALAMQYGMRVERFRLLDTMGWANPAQISRTVAAIRQQWPDVPLGLHLHDTRGLGIANAYAGLTSGVDEFDASIGGLGGCPFAGVKGAAGNIATEEFVLLCNELGVETGVDLDGLLACVRMAEEIIGRPLPGKVKAGGNLATYRRQAGSHAG